MRVIETSGELKTLFYLPDNLTLVSFGRKQGTPDSIQGWDVATGQFRFALTHREATINPSPRTGRNNLTGTIGSVFLSPGGTFLCMQHDANPGPGGLKCEFRSGLLLWKVPSNLDQGQGLTRSPVGCFRVTPSWEQNPRHLKVQFPVALSADERLLANCVDPVPSLSAISEEFHRLEIRRLNDGWLLGRLNCSSGISSLCFSPDGSELFAAGRNLETHVRIMTQIEFWNVSAQELIRSVELPTSYPPVNLFCSADGTMLIVHTERRLFLLNRKTGTIRNWLDAGEGAVFRCLAISPDGSRLMAGIGRTVRLLDTASLRLLETFDWDLGNVRAVAFSPDGMTMAAAGRDQTLVWDSPG